MDLHTMSFNLNDFDLDCFRQNFMSFCVNKDAKDGSTYYMHFLTADFNLITDNIIFDLTMDKIDMLIPYLYNKICNKNLTKYLGSRKNFYVHIGLKSLNALDFEIYRINSLCSL
jgi:hypothetical protein